MGLEDVESVKVNKPFKEGSVSDLIENLEILDHKSQGRFFTLDSNAGRIVEVEFITPDSKKQLTGYVEKWNSEGGLWVSVQREPNKSDLKHYLLSPDQNIRSRLINLNK